MPSRIHSSIPISKRSDKTEPGNQGAISSLDWLNQNHQRKGLDPLKYRVGNTHCLQKSTLGMGRAVQEAFSSYRL